jgi:zinc transporter, ZIP family
LSARPVLLALLPLALLVAVGAAFLSADPLRTFRTSAPPVEELTVERAVLDGDGIALRVRAGGSEPIRIAQVQVDGAYWRFAQDPPGPLAYLASAWLRLPYPWVVGEAHHVVVLTSTGAAFEYPIEVALATPDRNSLGALGLVGLFVGVVPVALGMLFYPALRAGGRGVFTFALALTVGLLLFLLVDTLQGALELSAEAAPGFHGGVLVWMVAALAALLLLAAGRRGGGNPQGIALATSIALGIGLHNLGEGLAIGSAFATGATALGSFLVLGFTLHNVTEGVGIVAPLLEDRPRLPVLAALAVLAGLPAVLGVWLGSYAFAPHWAALALAVGAGAIFQVVVEVGLLLARRARSDGRGVMGATAAGGVAAGVVLMYATALLVQA